VHIGDHLCKTTDLFTVTGMAVLIHGDPKCLAADPRLSGLGQDGPSFNGKMGRKNHENLLVSSMQHVINMQIT